MNVNFTVFIDKISFLCGNLTSTTKTKPKIQFGFCFLTINIA